MNLNKKMLYNFLLASSQKPLQNIVDAVKRSFVDVDAQGAWFGNGGQICQVIF